MGQIHIYTGENQKNLKTAHGMALRACGAGFSVGFYSFGEKSADIQILGNRLPNFQILENSFQDVSHLDMIILYDCHLAEHNSLQNFIDNKPQNIEIVLFGTAFSDDVLTKADLVSEIAAF